MVSVIGGPGDAVQEQERWESWVPVIEGTQLMSIGEQGFELESGE
ncbi:hypothetical protein [Enhygromyxa salina]|nr:hypothetical protein [Enhygromyxa salina]